MPQQIAGLYEIHRKIGSGGGGIVYLGWHMRLEKQIVLKADKRTLDTKPEKLRREVDMLKNLSYPYIPQVYDFVQDDGIVYTVMEFIDGESLDKFLNRGELPPQSQVIQWACQLLNALDYLHSRLPHGILHGDIKPANVMLRPDGDICLIDFNIALVLGENGAVKVGRSRGYASPEHYGIEYAPKNGYSSQRKGKRKEEKKKWRKGKETGDDETELMEQTETMPETQSMEESRPFYSEKSSSLASGQHPVTLDARSDIYSLGATLYHLLSGNRPHQDAREVEPLGPEICSPQVAEIIKKAMAPSAEMRYQNAKEMLEAFRQLHKNDIRTIRHRRRTIGAAALLSAFFFIGGACTFVGLKQMEQVQEALTLAEYSSNYLREGNRSEAVKSAMQAIPEGKSIFESPVTAQAQKALTDALGVYELSDGFKSLDQIGLSSAPFAIEVSPEGNYFAALCSGEAVLFSMEDQKFLVSLPLQPSALSELVFVDETTIVYAGEQGVTAYGIKEEKILWTGETATALALSGNGKVLAAVDRDKDFADIYRMSDGNKIGQCSFEEQHMQIPANDIFTNPQSSIFALNQDGSLLAVSFSGGGLKIFDLKSPDDNLIIFEQSEYPQFMGGFSGQYFAFAANESAESLFGLVDTVNAEYIGGYASPDNFFLTANEKGIYLANGNLLVKFEPDTMEEMELAYADDEKITGFSVGEDYVLLGTDTPGFSFYDRGANRMLTEACNETCDFVRISGKYALVGNRNEPSLRMLKLESHEEALVLSYDARYVHDEARISQDKQTIMLFDYKHFRIYNRAGKILAEENLPDASQIYDQQFRRSDEGSWLEVIWYDGTIRCYSASDGSLLSETIGTAPEKNLDEEFMTNQYRIISSLHGTPEVYDLQKGKKVAELEKDSYLTYVTQIGEWILTEYISASGERYGLLLDEKLQTLARLPGLCDYIDGMFIFDYASGNLRQCPRYSLEELVEMGNDYLDRDGKFNGQNAY